MVRPTLHLLLTVSDLFVSQLIALSVSQRPLHVCSRTLLIFSPQRPLLPNSHL